MGVRSVAEWPSSSDDSENSNGLLTPERVDDEATVLDQRFIGAAVDRPEAGRRAAFGFTETAPKRRQGQGTPCRRVLLRNAMLELLWVDRPRRCGGGPDRLRR